MDLHYCNKAIILAEWDDAITQLAPMGDSIFSEIPNYPAERDGNDKLGISTNTEMLI